MDADKKAPKSGAQRKRDHDQAKRRAGLKEFRAWVTREEAQSLRAHLERLRT